MTTTPIGFGARVDRFRRPEGFLDAARVEAAVDDRTVLVALTDRHNPTGRAADRDALERTAAAATANDADLLVDEVYAPFTATATDGAFGGPSIAGTDGVVVTGSLTKFLGFGGLRIGWLVADPEFVAADRNPIAGPVHDGATYALIAHDRLDGDELTDRALEDGVLVVPGRFFDRSGAVRVSLGRPTDQATAAPDALGAVLDDVD